MPSKFDGIFFSTNGIKYNFVFFEKT